MKRTRYGKEQIAFALRQHQAELVDRLLCIRTGRGDHPTLATTDSAGLLRRMASQARR